MGVERALATISERALQKGAQAGLEVLPREVMRLTGATSIVLYEGRNRISEAGRRVSVSGATRAPQGFLVKHGRITLAVSPERLGSAERPVLERFARLGSSLLAARKREIDAQARQARLGRELREQAKALSFRERNRSRASHDLRTPLLVIRGYLDMMRKGMIGELTPPVERYLQRMMSATQDMNTLISQRLAPGSAPEDLRALLSTAFTPSSQAPRKLSLSLQGPATVPLKGPASTLALLMRTLARGLEGTGAVEATGTIEAREPMKMWRLHLSAPAERPLAKPVVKRLEPLVQLLGGTLSITEGHPLELTLNLPAA
ncbi:histidine kinase dimerization/phospho-acceptor domain-containing protein [Stigmatella sp. ncwal1]|uniref:histidine kinase n=1 Tax=Stigmatella ashevillensis TaxID=2995309 RepID=A0ABT5DN38_9BACT|nr:histidine kinase dimerization/phospho-acceptor domain-containing protein [Stigmatella ashevillena]MDC0715077.1 histidine kinase dimerization/phospho-acceptor domain-containing protein [Stigmatella ashevillena]